jgi:hypothetical protein
MDGNSLLFVDSIILGITSIWMRSYMNDDCISCIFNYDHVGLCVSDKGWFFF